MATARHEERTTSLMDILEIAMPKASRYRQGWRSNRWLDDFLNMMKARLSMSPMCKLGLNTLVSYAEGVSFSTHCNLLEKKKRVCRPTATVEPFLPTPPFRMT